MAKNVLLKFIFIIILFPWHISGQDLKLTSKVELRNWKLSNKAMKSGKFVDQASVELRNASGVISTVRSDAEGNFSLNIPATGEFTMTINYSGQHPKKYLVSTKGTSPDKDANFRPQINIAGMISIKHTKDMNYLGLDQTYVKTENSTVIPRTTINDGEYKLIQKFCTANKLGDMALENKNYSLAKTFYEMATDIIGGEPYPKDQLKKAEEGLKIEKLSSRKKQRSKQSKVKSAITTKSGTSKSPNSSNKSSSVETGKHVRKTRKVLGK